MSNNSVKIALVDDHAFVNDMLAKIIDRFEGYQVILKARNGQELIAQLKAGIRPDLVILDINMPIMDGYETAQWLQTNYPTVPILVITMIDSELSHRKLIELGVKGILTKQKDTTELQQALQSVMEKDYYFSNKLLVKMLQGRPSSNGCQLQDFNAQEIAFIKKASKDITYTELAAEMRLPSRTVEYLRNNVFTKTGVKSRVGLVLFAIKNGLVNGEEH